MRSDPPAAPDPIERRAAKRELISTLLGKAGLARETVADILPREVSGAAPLSFAQERLWFLDQLDPGNSVYHIRRAFRLNGPLELRPLTRALNAVVRRHDILRTSFPALDGSPIQRIAPACPDTIPRIDLRRLAPRVREAEMLRLAHEETGVKFSMADGPLWRCRLIRLGKTKQVLLFTVHQILLDGWSLGLFFREIETLYESFSTRRPAALPDLPVQYGDFAAWQRARLRAGELDEQLDYWKKKLSGPLTALALPADLPRPLTRTLRGARYDFVLGKSITAALKQLSREESVTLFATLMAAFNVLLYRYAGQADIVVGFPIANRERAEIQSLLGSFVNTLALRTDLSGKPTFRRLLARVSRACRDAYAHQDLPFERLVDELGGERDLSRNPLFQVMFAYHNALPENFRLAGLRCQALPLHSVSAKFDLTLSLGERDAGLAGFFEYRTELFERPTIARMAGHFKRLLKGIVAERDQAISTLPLVTEPERRRMLVRWNDTAAAYSRNLCLHRSFEAQTKRTPHAVAVECGGARLTYAELSRRANQLARYLRRLGAGPEKIVGVCLERSVEMVIALLGVLKSGAAYLPLDPKYPPARLAFMVADARVAILLSEKKIAGGALALRVNRPRWNKNFKVVCLDAAGKKIAGEPGRAVRSGVRAANLAYVIYTSGSTGQPKGVAIEHRNAVAFLSWAKSVFPPAELSGVLASTSICFDLSVFELFAPLGVGGRVCLVQDALAVADLRERNDITLINTVPSAMRELLAAGALPKSVRTVNLAGEPLTAELVRQIGASGSVAKIYDLYGPSETTTYSTFALRAAGGRASIGRPIANTQVYLLDADFQPVPIGVPGELFIGGAGVARGYLGHPELTKEKFLPNPFAAGRMYRSGDLARYLADGKIEYLGRADDQIKIRGYRIELGEVEAALAAHGAVRQAVVAARESALVAYFVPKNSMPPSALDLRNYLRARLPEFMVPAQFIALPSLPATSSGKVDRRALAALDAASREEIKTSAGPRNEIEELIAQAWREALGVEQVGVFDNFFLLGGHSLLATKLAARLRAAFDVELPLRKLFDGPTVAELAEAIEALRRDRRRVSLPAPLAAPRADRAPLAFAQRRLWFLHKVDPDLTAYHMPAAYRIEGPFDRAVLERSLAALLERHEALRSAIIEIDGEPVQQIAPQAALKAALIDLTHLAAGQAEREAERLASEDARRPFALGAAPLVRAAILRLAGDVHVLLLNFHHIICDGASLAVFYRELAALYNSRLEGREAALAPLALQYRDFAVWQRQLLRQGRLQPQLDYWRGQLTGATTLDLPSDRLRPAVQSYRGARVAHRLSGELTAVLKRLAGKEQVTLFMVLLASLKILLARLAGQTQVVIGSTLAGRIRAELEGVIGFFINPVALRSDLSGDPMFVELLKRVREVCVDAYTHQDLPFERIVEELNPQRDPSRNPVFQVLFNMAEIAERDLHLSGCKVTRLSRPAPGAKFDLVVQAPQIDGAIELVLLYNAELFDRARMHALLGAWSHLLGQIAEKPARRLAEFSLVCDAAKSLLPNPAEPLDDQWRGAVHSWIAARADARPDKAAIVDGAESWSYRELEEASNRLAHGLVGAGIGAGDVVGIYAHRDASLAPALLGVLKAGAVFAVLDPAYPPARTINYLRAARPAGMVEMEGAGKLPDEIEAHLRQAGLAARVKLPRAQKEIARLFARSPRRAPDVAIAAADPAYIAFTSGSTGGPKGVLCRHGPITHFLPWQAQTFELNDEDRYALLSGLGYNHLHRDLFTALALGATLCVPGAGDLKDPTRLARWLERRSISILHLTPALGRFLRTAKGRSLPSVRRVFFGGELLLRQDILAMRELLPHARFVSFYGATETQRAVGFYIVPDLPPDTDQRARQAIPAGRGAPGVQLLLLTPAGQLAGIGEIGELHIRSPHLAAGYVDDGALGEMNFITNPFTGDPRDRLYRTREWGRYLADGNVEWLGRNPRRANIRGFRVELAEVERALGACPGVRQAAVLAQEFPAAETPITETRLLAYIAPEQMGATDAAAVAKFLRAALPAYMLPSCFYFVGQLPLSANGKIDYGALPSAQPPPADAGNAGAEPRGEIERAVGEVFAEVLQLGRVGRQDNFFDLGGHSLLAARAAARLRERLGVELDLRDFLERPTVEAICRRMQAANAAVRADHPQTQPEREVIEL